MNIAEHRLPGFLVDDGRYGSRVLRVVRVLVAASGAVRSRWVSSGSGASASASFGTAHVTTFPVQSICRIVNVTATRRRGSIVAYGRVRESFRRTRRNITARISEPKRSSSARGHRYATRGSSLLYYPRLSVARLRWRARIMVENRYRQLSINTRTTGGEFSFSSGPFEEDNRTGYNGTAFGQPTYSCTSIVFLETTLELKEHKQRRVRLPIEILSIPETLP